MLTPIRGPQHRARKYNGDHKYSGDRKYNGDHEAISDRGEYAT